MMQTKRLPPGLLLGVGLALAGCGTREYEIPDVAVQRAAALPLAEQVRAVVPAYQKGAYSQQRFVRYSNVSGLRVGNGSIPGYGSYENRGVAVHHNPATWMALLGMGGIHIATAGALVGSVLRSGNRCSEYCPIGLGAIGGGLTLAGSALIITGIVFAIHRSHAREVLAGQRGLLYVAPPPAPASGSP